MVIVQCEGTVQKSDERGVLYLANRGYNMYSRLYLLNWEDV